MCVFKEKVHSLSVAPKPLAIWNKELEGLDSELFKLLKTSSVVALSWIWVVQRTESLSYCSPKHIPGFFYLKRTWIQDLGIFSGSLLLSDIVVWWWLSVNAICSWVVQCWYILSNMLVLEYCSFTHESSFIEFCLFTVSFVRFVLLVLPVQVHRLFGL